MATESEYVLGTHDAEVERLGLQHRVWRPRATAAWQRAGFAPGRTLIDVGCGPGFATLDLAEIVGRSGRIVALDKSRRFLDVVGRECTGRGISHVETREVDFDTQRVPSIGADGAWCRWVFAFVRQPRALLLQLRDALKPGGTLVVHEYFDYSTWRLAPQSAVMEEFVAAVMESWRAEGGEPDIGLQLPAWLEAEGFDIRFTQTITDVVTPQSHIWHWGAAFMRIGSQRLASLGRITSQQAGEVVASLERAERDPSSRMVTPGVLELIAAKR